MFKTFLSYTLFQSRLLGCWRVATLRPPLSHPPKNLRSRAVCDLTRPSASDRQPGRVTGDGRAIVFPVLLLQEYLS